MSKHLTEIKFRDMISHPTKTIWKRVLECFECTQEQIREAAPYFDSLAWMRVGIQKCIDETFLREFADKINWYDLPYDSFSIEFIREFRDKIAMDVCIGRKTLKLKNEKFWKEYKREAEVYIKKYGRLKEKKNANMEK